MQRIAAETRALFRFPKPVVDLYVMKRKVLGNGNLGLADNGAGSEGFQVSSTIRVVACTPEDVEEELERNRDVLKTSRGEAGDY